MANISPGKNAAVVSTTTGTGNPAILLFSYYDYQAYSDEEYKASPHIYFKQRAINTSGYYLLDTANVVHTDAQSQYEYRACICIDKIMETGFVVVYNDPLLTVSGTGYFDGAFGASYSGYDHIETTPYTSGNLPGGGAGAFNNPTINWLDEWELSTNIPIFNTVAEASQYIEYGDNIQNAVNNNIPSVEGRAFEITNIWTEGTWTQNGDYTPASGSLHHRDVRGRINDESNIAMYPVEGISEGGLVYNVITTGNITDLEYSEDGVVWIPTSTFPYSYFYRPRVDEFGTFKFALTYYSDRVPVFEDEQTAQGYIDGDIPITDALNWNEISNDYPGEDLPIDVGEEDDGTDWGEVYTENFFANTYLCPTGALREIANKLYDTTPAVWDAIKTGLEMFGNNPIESVISLIYYPIDLSSVFSNISESHNVWFGGYNFDNMQNAVYRVIYPNGYFYCGAVDFTPIYGEGNWKNFKACRIFVDLPYCGRYELDPAKYWGKHIKVVYYIDLTTGGCVASLINGSGTGKDGVCLDQFNGVIGTKLSMTLTDFSAYANAQINTLLGSGGQAISNGTTMGESGANSIASGNALGVVSASGAAAALGAIQGAKTVYGLQMNNINKFNQTRGGSSGMLNQYGNQKPTFIFIYPDTDNPDNFNKMYGTPSNAGGLVSSFTGYFEADTIKLNISGATESEKDKIRSLLMGGIYIGNRT